MSGKRHTPLDRVIDTPVSSRRLTGKNRPSTYATRSLDALEANQKQPGIFGERCTWLDCIEYVDPDYRVHLCTDHANHVRDTMNARDAEIEQRSDQLTAEARANRERSARKLDAGKPLTEGDIAPGWVYYVELDGLIKIGFSKDVTRRMRQYAPTARLLAVEPGTKKVEKERHQTFRAHLARGREWFRDTDEIRTWITTVTDQFGPADDLAHQWTKPPVPTVGGKRITGKRRYAPR